MNERYKKLLGNTVIFAIGNFSAKLIRFLMLRVYSDVLSTEEYGIVDTVFLIAEILMPLLTLGIIEAVLRFALDGEDNRDQILTSALRITLIGCAVMTLAAPLIGLWLPQYARYIALSVLYFGFYTLRSVLAQFVRGIGLVKAFAVNGILYAFSTAALNILFLVVFPMGVQGYLLSSVLSAAIACVHFFFVARLHKYIRLRLPKTGLTKQMLSYSAPLIPNTISWLVMPYANRLILIAAYDLSTAGMYAMAAAIPNAVTMITTMFQQAWQISSVQEYEKADRDEFYSGVFLRFAQVLFPAGAGLILISPLLARFLMQNEFYQAWVYIPLLVIAAIFAAFSGFFGTIYLVTKTSRRSMATTMAGAVSSVVMCVILIRVIGVQGAAAATMLGQFVTCVSRVIDTRRFVKLRLPAVRLSVSLLLLLAQAVAYIAKQEAAWPVCALLFAAVVLMYVRELFSMAAMLLRAAADFIKSGKK